MSRGVMGGSSKPPEPSDEQRELERQQMELMELQLKQAQQPIKLPDIKPPKPLPPPPPPAHESSSEVLQKMEEEKRKAARRTNTARNTIFAGETGGYQKLGGTRNLLG